MAAVQPFAFHTAAAGVVAVACGRDPITVPTPPTSELSMASVVTPEPAVDEGPAIVVRNPESVDIDIYAAYLVDRRGDRGTRVLWPHRFDCPALASSHVVPSGGMFRLPAPTQAYVPGRCQAEPLPDGEYALRLDSGYGEELYAAAVITLPLDGLVELAFQRHEKGPACTPELARRAAVLAFAAAPALPDGFARECDLDRARCGSLPIDDTLPPPACTVTLHERLLRVERAAGDDAPRTLQAWADHEIVYVRAPEITRTSASRIDVDGHTVVIAGATSQHFHEHGGDAAGVGSARFLARNRLSRALPVRVTGVEWLTDHSCDLPGEVRARPPVVDVSVAELVPGDSEITVGFQPQGAYQAHCDRFASRVTFRVEGQTIAATVEHEVTRFEPLHD